MTAKKKGKTAKRRFEPSVSKTPKSKEDPSKFDHERFSWCVNDRYIDYTHQKYGWDKIEVIYFLREIVQALQSYEGLTWHEVKCKEHCHPCEVETLPRELYNRLQERQIFVDELFQISFGNKPRLVGYKEMKVFYLMWYDPTHKINPTKAK